MFTVHPYSNLRGIDARIQLQTMDRLQDHPHVFDPYLKNPTGRYSTIDTFDTGSCAYRIKEQQTHQKLLLMKPEVQNHIQAPRNSLYEGLQFPMTEYTYPTLNVLFNGSNPLHTANDNGILHEEYEQRSTTGKQTKTEKLHPFYRRQNLAPLGDWLTRTRDKYRVVYTDKQKKLLEDEYEKTRFLPDTRRADLAKETELSERQIKFWFQNRRAKDKRNRKASKRENNSTKAASDKQTFTRDIQTVESDSRGNKQMEELIPSCKYTSQKCNSKLMTPPINDDQVEKQQQQSTHMDTVSPLFTSSCKYSKLQPSLSPTYGSCRYVTNTGCSEKNTFSSTGSQYLYQHPVSPSEWTLANQRSYFVNSIAMSPLLNSLQYDYRL